MDVNPHANVVVFEVKRLWKKETFAEGTPTQASGGVETAWKAVQAKTGARPAQVLNIYSEWEPSTEDAAFIARTFPNAEVSYSFSRPDEDDWQAAFAEATRVMQAAGEQAVSAMHEQRAQGQSVLLPILRTYEPGDTFAQVGVYHPVTDDLAVFLAYAGPTPRGTIGIDYVMRKDAATSPEAAAELFETAWQNLRQGLKVNVSETAGGKVYAFSHAGNMAASALALPDFYAQASSWIGPEVFVAFTDPNSLFVTLPESEAANTLRQAVEQSEYWGSVSLTLACYLLTASGMRLIAARSSAP